MTFGFIWLALKRTVSTQLALLVPWHVRRILYLLAVYRTVTGVKQFELTELDELNRRFHLASTGTEALVLSGAVTQWIKWFDASSYNPLAIVGACPQWLSYGYSNEMREDTDLVLHYIQQRA